jgi:hypothetical protein
MPGASMNTDAESASGCGGRGHGRSGLRRRDACVGVAVQCLSFGGLVD